MPYMVSDPQKLDAELKAGVTDERPSFIGYSLKDKNAQTKAEQQLQQEEEIASKNELAETAENLRDAINTAYEKNIKHGQELADELRSALQNTNPELEAELADVVRFTDISDGDTENKNNLLQCGEGVALLSALTNGAFPRVDGWTIYDPENADSNLEDNTRAANTKDLWMDMVTGKPQEEFNIVGSVVNTEGALRFRIDTVDMVEPGDLLVSKEGHIVAVIDKYIDENGVTHLKVFDVNFDEKNGGQARIGDITNENMNQNVAGLSEGQSTQYLAISNY
ncbi:hypothetical protein A2115_03235 [Candidatus Woesebacteria bacterium GWA1_41_8]|uniref:Uncharacterized protein n=1 Tax=Candidatus Woesebacteria bacterium GWA1_41_8 TaxID=1802471 RepID=A0A1F7WHM9_9BACT|nr:MAG: hypothetical protein A2115_03235 [Candidatus Woesebacteria bacterium GWA1_41_8]